MLLACCIVTARAASQYDNPDTLVVARDGTGQFRNVADAIEVCRAFMEYHKVIYVKKGTYKEKLVVPSGLPTSRFVAKTATRPLSPGTIMPTSCQTSPH